MSVLVIDVGTSGVRAAVVRPDATVEAGPGGAADTRDGLGLIATAAESSEIADGCDDTAGVCFVPALVGLGAPEWDYGARGTLLGLTSGTGRPEVVRAVLEGVAHRGADLVEAAEADSELSLPWPTASGVRWRCRRIPKPPRSVPPSRPAGRRAKLAWPAGTARRREGHVAARRVSVKLVGRHRTELTESQRWGHSCMRFAAIDGRRSGEHHGRDRG